MSSVAQQTLVPLIPTLESLSIPPYTFELVDCPVGPHQFDLLHLWVALGVEDMVLHSCKLVGGTVEALLSTRSLCNCCTELWAALLV